jgi:serine/threonine protein kinase
MRDSLLVSDKAPTPEWLFRSLDSEESLLQVARPVALATSYSTLITAAITGVPLDRILKPSPNSVPHVRATAHAIAGLHHLQAAAPQRSVTTEITQIHHSGETVLGTYPALESQVRTVIERVASGLADAPMSFVHGDLKPEHILVDDDGRVAIIDFELSVMADPMIDIAHFIALLERSTSRSRTRENENARLIPVFLDEYFANAPGDGLPRLALYHAAAAVHKAAGHCRTPTTEYSNQAEQILDEAMQFVSSDLPAYEAPSFKRRMTHTA